MRQKPDAFEQRRYKSGSLSNDKGGAMYVDDHRATAAPRAGSYDFCAADVMIDRDIEAGMTNLKHMTRPAIGLSAVGRERHQRQPNAQQQQQEAYDAGYLAAMTAMSVDAARQNGQRGKSNLMEHPGDRYGQRS